MRDSAGETEESRVFCPGWLESSAQRPPAQQLQSDGDAGCYCFISQDEAFPFPPVEYHSGLWSLNALLPHLLS